jgi:hypothetical protein
MEKTLMEKSTNTIETVGLLIGAAQADTIFRDVYLRRARDLLSPTLDQSRYRALGSTQREIDELMRRTRSAVLQHNWKEAAEVSARADHLRQTMAAVGPLADIGRDVYEADPVAFDPFSPGKHLGPQSQANQPAVYAQLLDTLASLGKLDTNLSALYERRRNYFSGLEVATMAASQKSSERDTAQLEQRAVNAAERGDVATLQELMKKLRDRNENGAGEISAGAAAVTGRYEPPADLAVPFPPDVSARARELGLAETHIATFPEIKAAGEVIYTYAWQSSPSTPDMEREGVLRTEALVESQIPKDMVTEELRVLAGQFIQQIFVNSGGARYLPRVSAETTLIEDFAEDESADAPSKLLAALELPLRHGRARTEIETALMRFGDQIVAERLGLDPMEFRLVCIPYDLYMRVGRERGWGHWPHWTHFDGYQVMDGNHLRALVGGDGRFGGVTDLVSLSRSDARESVYARFAVVRRTRMVARWW